MKLIVIDPHVIDKSPSMRSWIKSLPTFRHMFDSIEVWASECSLNEDDGIIWKRIPQRLPTWHLHLHDFRHQANNQIKRARLDSNTIIQCTGCYTDRADIRYMHFWNCAYLEEREKRPEQLRLPVHQRMGVELSARVERKIAIQNQSKTWWWVVSNSLRDRIERQVNTGQFRILPNPYDSGRFNTSVRMHWRERMRSHLNIPEDEHIMAFSAFGGFERKGLLQALECISHLRKNGHRVRLLVIGGEPSSITRVKRRMQAVGIHEQCCIFVGMVDQIERYLSAAEAFLFPSHFEAFSIAEIEAAALGLRLYLTPHYGSEMILREPINGRLLPWDPTKMADIIAGDIASSLINSKHDSMGHALTLEGYKLKLGEYYSEVINSKK